jgi:hypothetical protein
VRPALQYYLSGRWTPRTIGKLVAWWDAEARSSLSLSGSSVVSWMDIVGGVAVSQAVVASQPAYSASSFNNRPGLTFDGTADELTGTPATLSGATTGEMWALVDQTALVANTNVRCAFTMGSTTANKRELARVVDSGANRARAATFTGSTTPTAQDTTVDFSGRCVLRAIFAPTLLTVEINGTTTSTVITANNTATTRVRIGANPAATAGNFWQGVINSALVFNAPLTTDEANRVRAYFTQRMT